MFFWCGKLYAYFSIIVFIVLMGFYYQLWQEQQQTNVHAFPDWAAMQVLLIMMLSMLTV